MQSPPENLQQAQSGLSSGKVVVVIAHPKHEYSHKAERTREGGMSKNDNLAFLYSLISRVDRLEKQLS